MTNSENIKLAADHKREEAKRKLASMFRVAYPFSSGIINELVDDIISAAILEISAIQAKASESNT